MKTILGIDTGSSNLGWAVVRDQRLLGLGLHKPAPSRETINAQTISRMRVLLPTIRQLIADHQVTHLAIELVPITNMGQRDKVLGTANMLRTVAMYEGLHYTELAANTIKKRFTGNGNAPKPLVRDIALARYKGGGIIEPGLRPDVYDAVAVATVANWLGDNEWWHPVDTTPKEAA